jgi:hypothetical protein
MTVLNRQDWAGDFTMKRTTHTAEQIIRKLKTAEQLTAQGKTVATSEVGGIEVDVGEAGMVQRLAQKDLHLHACASGRRGSLPIWRCRWPSPALPPGRRPYGWRIPPVKDSITTA